MSKPTNERDHFDVLADELSIQQLLELIDDLGWSKDETVIGTIDRLQKRIESHVTDLEHRNPYTDNPLGRDMLEAMKQAAPGSHWHKIRERAVGYNFA